MEGIEFPIFQKDLTDLFGDPRDEGFQTGYLRTLDLTDMAGHFSHVRDYEGNQWGCKIYCNYIIHEQLRQAFLNIIQSGYSLELRSYDGCFAIRQMRGSNSMSVHSWGMAVDLNATENPFGGKVSFSDKFIRCFADAGFESGALWTKKDGMHQQACWTRDWRGSNNLLAPIVWQG